MMQGDGLPSAYRKVDYLERTVEGAVIAIRNDELEFAGCDIFARFTVIGPNSGERAYMGGYGDLSGGIAWEIYYPTNVWEGPGISVTKISGEMVLGTPADLHFKINSGKSGLVLGQYRYGAYQSQNRIHYCRIEKDGFVLRELYPCVRKSDSEPGMYDTVTKTFYTNAGKGEFIVPA